MGTRRSRHNKGRKPIYKEHRQGTLSSDALNFCAVDLPPPRAPRQVPTPEDQTERAVRYNQNKAPYRRVATGRVINAGFNYLSDLIVRPGIQKFLWPLLLYRGQMNPGHAHRLWNMALLMMASEAETLSDGIRLVNNPVFSQLCGPVRAPAKHTMWTFFGRLWENQDTADLIPGLREYVRSLELGPSGLTPIPLETSERYCAPWRISAHPKFDPDAPRPARPESGARNLFYPYMIHDIGEPTEGHELVKLVNSVVPHTLPEQWRADVCQELIVGILSGEVSRGAIHDHVAKFISGQFKANPIMFGGDGEPHGLRFSLDKKFDRGDDERTLHDTLRDGSHEHWSDAEEEAEPSYQDVWEQADRQIRRKRFPP